MVRITCSLKRRPDISFEEFDEIWTNHAKVFTGIKYTQDNFIRYTQFHVKKDLGAPFLEFGMANVNEFDGIAHFDMENVDVFVNLMKDDEYLRVVAPDEQRFLDRGSVQIHIGVDEDFSSEILCGNILAKGFVRVPIQLLELVISVNDGQPSPKKEFLWPFAAMSTSPETAIPAASPADSSRKCPVEGQSHD
ncbi:hypothetical protein C8J56DRAFT_1168209 [Mycena floridula]|nr:hypothetical protein C8J56DRAFT_1168209 [Mycena floridula]